jgi:hypothetical protein
MSNENELSEIGVVLLIPAFFFNAFVIMMLWNWFVSPLGVMTIGMAHALGINVLVTHLTSNGIQEQDITIKYLVKIYVRLVVVFAIGAFLYWLM